MATGQIDHITVTAGGSGYTSAPTVTLAAPPTGGTQATARALLLGDAVIAVQVVNPGAGYAYPTPPAVSFSGGGGSGAAATAALALASYATVAQLREYLKDVPAGGGYDAQLQHVLDRATGICNDANVGLGFAFDGYVTESRPVLADHSLYLVLPAHRPGSVQQISLSNQALTDYVSDADGTIRRFSGSQWGSGWGSRDDWGWRGLRYDVIADWGHGPPPDSAVEVCLEVAVNLWQSKEAGRFSNVVGVQSEGGTVVGYEGALTPLQRSVLQGLKDRAARGLVAV